MNGVAFFVQTERRRYETQVDLWISSVMQAPRVIDALRAAQREPGSHPMIRFSTGPVRSQALRRIEQILKSRLDALPDSERDECARAAFSLTSMPSLTAWARHSEESRRAT